MIHHTAHTLGALQAFLSTAIGTKLGLMLAQVAQLPEWSVWFTGPFGGLVGMVVAVWWLSKRLDRAEARAEARDATYVELVRTNAQVIAQNNEILRAVQGAMEHVAEATRGCPGREPD
jgi:hypothetical protein